MWAPDICIYHGDCDDGFTAAWAIWEKWPDIEFYGAKHGQEIAVDVLDKNVLFVDFCPKARDMWRWKAQPKSVVILDHHVTAEQDLADVHRFKGGPDAAESALFIAGVVYQSNMAAWFDMEHSGAWLAWQFANGTDDPDIGFIHCREPMIVQLVEDRDLWRYNLGDDTRHFSAALRTFENWTWIAPHWSELLADGAVIRKAEMKVMRDLSEQYCEFAFIKRPPPVPPGNTGAVYGRTIYNIPIVNAPYHYASDLANYLLKTHPEAPFAACWFVRADGKVQWSLRSEDSRTNVSEIAKALGGGGHRNASGFEGHVQDIVTGFIRYES